MGEHLNGTLKDFKYSVLKQRKFYNKVKNLPEYSNLSYSVFRSQNISFDVFEAAFLNIDNSNLINPAQINNIFRYLSNNLRGSKESEIKRVIVKIEKLRVNLVNKICILDQEKDKVAINNISIVIDELKQLKKIIIDSVKNNKDIEKEIDFDMLIDDLLYPDSYDTSTLLTTLFYNLPVLNNGKSNAKKFNDKFYRAMLRAMRDNINYVINYYKYLANLIDQGHIYKLDKRVLNICGFNKYKDVSKSKLNEKIMKLDYDDKTGRYRLNDYIITIDNEETSKFDDAISVEKIGGGYILGIHIADVYSLGILPMSKESIEFKSQASLKQRVDKNAISLFVEISDTGLILDKKVLMTIVNVNNNLLYDDVSKILYNKNDDRLCKTVVDLIGLYNIVNNSRLPEFPGPSSMAHSLVQKFMLLYGCVISDISSKNNYPILYQRDNDKKSEVSLSEVYVNTGFDDNNLNTYARFTSPIWDLRSFINQTSICKCIFDRIDLKEKNILRLQLNGYKNEINKANKPSTLQE